MTLCRWYYITIPVIKIELNYSHCVANSKSLHISRELHMFDKWYVDILSFFVLDLFFIWKKLQTIYRRVANDSIQSNSYIKS